MLVVFRRSGERRYSVEAQRPGLPDVVMPTAPGYDDRMPHDMMHMIVEAQLELTHAIFGQLAAGGTAGTFHLSLTSSEGSRETARASKRVRVRGKKFLKEGRDHCVRGYLALHPRKNENSRSRWRSRRKKCGKLRALMNSVL
jgi:hypothetical protein